MQEIHNRMFIQTGKYAVTNEKYFKEIKVVKIVVVVRTLNNQSQLY